MREAARDLRQHLDQLPSLHAGLVLDREVAQRRLGFLAGGEESDEVVDCEGKRPRRGECV